MLPTLKSKKDYIKKTVRDNYLVLVDVNFQEILLERLTPIEIDTVWRRLKNLLPEDCHGTILIDRIKKKEGRPSSSTNINYDCYVTAKYRTK